LSQIGTFQKERNPLVSIITVNYNSGSTIEQTIKSVINQTYLNINYIIIDGGSQDDSLNIIQRYKSYLKYWKSERDNGIYDAMNKGIKAISEYDSYILFLNADDYLYSNSTIERIVSYFDNEDFIYGKILSIGESIQVFLGKELTLNDLPINMIQHQATFIKRSLFEELGNFNVSYKIAADYDFAVRVMKSNYKYKFVNEVVAVMRMGGASSKIYQTTFREKSQIIKIHYRGLTKTKALFFINFYEIPKHIVSNFLKELGVLMTWRRLKKSRFKS
jgi:glycosyltransferase involved in cell wall biosynthesis